MNRYIEADALNKAFSKLRFNDNGELKHYGDRSNWILWGSEVETLLADAPGIDIVRCKECKFSRGVLEYCTNNHWVGNTNDYCSYAERREI